MRKQESRKVLVLHTIAAVVAMVYHLVEIGAKLFG